ncbi:MAG: hypothetical protein ACYC59_09415 [Anaerolineaceae bacterium]
MKTTSSKAVRRWLKWIFRTVLLGILIALAYSLYFYKVKMILSHEDIQKADTAFDSGIKIDDEQDDFVIMGSNKEVSNENNPSPYRLSFLDIRSLEVGTDQNYLYYKVTFFDVIPDQPISINDDQIRDIGCKLNVVDQENMDQEILSVDTGYLPIINFPSLSTYYFYDPTGIQEPEIARFNHQDSDSKLYGGVGEDYILGAFPLQKLNLQVGQEIYMTFSMETRSEQYTHAAVDVLLGSGKQPAIIKWVIGTNIYQIIEFKQNGIE